MFCIELLQAWRMSSVYFCIDDICVAYALNALIYNQFKQEHLGCGLNNKQMVFDISI